MVLILVAVPIPAKAIEWSGGVGLGGIQVGTAPRFAVSPHARLSWRTQSGFLFALHELVSIVVAPKKDGLGVYSHTSSIVGYAWESIDFGLGPSLSIYSIPACGDTLCGRVAGVAPGGHAQANVYFAGPLGLSVSADVDWVGGKSLVLPGGVATTVVAGPVLRWRSE